jgi:hypothetical protein
VDHTVEKKHFFPIPAEDHPESFQKDLSTQATIQTKNSHLDSNHPIIIAL